MSDADGIGLCAHDRRHADASKHRGTGRAFDERAARQTGTHGISPFEQFYAV
jgi:hypothetical protein